VAQRHDDAFNARDANGRMEIEAPDIEVIMPGGMTLRGPEQVIEVVKLFWEALPDGKIIAQNRFAAGDSVVAEGTLRGTHRGTFRAPSGEIPPTGNSVTLRYATIKRIQGGRLVSEHLYFDQLEFLQQLGVFPTPRP
jgi:predicted ester cyclase